MGRAPPAAPTRTRPVRDRAAILDAAKRLAALRVRNQGTARLRHGAGPTRSTRHRSRLHFFGGAGSANLFRRHSAPEGRTLSKNFSVVWKRIGSLSGRA